MKIATDKIAPALDRQIAELEAHRRRATSDAGVWKLPRGDEYYAWALRAGTTTRMTPDEIHQRGQEELRALQSEMDGDPEEAGFHARHRGRAHDGARQGNALPFRRQRRGPRAGSWRFSMRVSPTCASGCRARSRRWCRAIFEIKRMAPEVEPGAPGAYGGRGHHRRQGAGQVLDQPAHDERVHHLQHADAHLSRIHSRSRLAGRIHLQTTAGAFAAGVQRVFGRLGAVCRATRQRARCVRRRSVRPARLSAIHCVPRLPAGRRHRACTRNAGHASRPSNGSPAPTARASRKSPAKWTATARGPARPAATRSVTARSTACAPRRKGSLGKKFDLRKFNDAVVKGGGVPMLTLARTIDAFIGRTSHE